MKIMQNPPDYDHDNVVWEGTNGNGFIGRDKGDKICIIKCPECEQQNYSPAVTSGKCSWCGFDANLPINKENDGK